MVLHRCSVLFYREKRLYQKVWSVLFFFITTLIVYSIKKFHETYWYSSSTAYQEKSTDWILRIFTFNDKDPFYLPIISTNFWGSKWSRSNRISHKAVWHIPIIKNSEFKLIKMQFFSKPPFIFHLIF